MDKLIINDLDFCQTDTAAGVTGGVLAFDVGVSAAVQASLLGSGSGSGIGAAIGFGINPVAVVNTEAQGSRYTSPFTFFFMPTFPEEKTLA